ncbi:MAG: ImmA/IrrE family metallo-endopeptidase [Bacillota bacterium]|nr:ImmA/IrrE family metallo-endopeptidase [Bacillota bacterium]
MGSYLPPGVRASNILRELEIIKPPIPVEDICRHFDIECIVDADIESEALLIIGEKISRPLIAVKANKRYESRVKFSLAHELGHYIIPEHQDSKYYCTLGDLNDYHEKSAEIEANQFAAELLIPSQWLTPEIRRHDVTLNMLKTFAEKFETSLSSTAIKVAGLCSDRIAVVYTQNGQIRWHKKSESFDLYLASGNLKSLSIASRLYQESAISYEGSGLVPLDAWSYDDRQYNELYEESIYMPFLNSTLTLLRIPYDEFEEESDDW